MSPKVEKPEKPSLVTKPFAVASRRKPGARSAALSALPAATRRRIAAAGRSDGSRTSGPPDGNRRGQRRDEFLADAGKHMGVVVAVDEVGRNPGLRLEPVELTFDLRPRSRRGRCARPSARPISEVGAGQDAVRREVAASAPSGGPKVRLR